MLVASRWAETPRQALTWINYAGGIGPATLRARSTDRPLCAARTSRQSHRIWPRRPR